MILDVISEGQVSNDPDPFWQHVSLRNSEMKSSILSGNVLFVPASKPPKVFWKNNDFIRVEFNGNYGQSFRKEEANSKFLDKVFVEVVINQCNSN